MSHDRRVLREQLAPQISEKLFDGSPDAVYVLSLDGSFIDANDVLLERLATSREDLLTEMRFQPTVVSDELDEVQSKFNDAAAGKTVRYRATAINVHGGTFRAEIVNTPLYLEGEVVAVLGIARDIGPAEEDARAHIELEQRFERVLNTISDGIIFVNTDWQITYVNPKAESIRLLTSAELVGRYVWEVAPPSLSRDVRDAFRMSISEQRTITITEYNPDLDLWLEITMYPSSSGLALFVRDITDAVEAHTRAKETESKIAAQAALLDIARDAIVVRGLDHTVSYWNAAAVELYGWSAGEAIGSVITDLSYGGGTVAFFEAHNAALKDGSWSGELEQYTKSGQTIIVDCRWSVVYDDNGEPESILAVNSDITDRKREAERSIRTQRMESLGTLAGGIAHDLNNILTPMLMSVQLLAEEETDSVNLEILRLLETGVTRGADMVRQVVSFAKGVESRKVRVDVMSLIAELEEFSATILPETVSLKCRVDAAVPPILGDPTQLVQVLVNLVTNARDAMPTGGVLTIDAHAGETNNAVIVVTDSGDGMSEEVLASIFEPFFTTKLNVNGTGLGLATSASIIDNHGATVVVDSALGAGTTFTITFPEGVFGEAESQQSESSFASSPPRGNGEHLLVVDDDSTVRAAAGRTLELNGYRVTTAGNGAEALALIASDIGGFDLVFTDMTMPVVGGMATAESLHALHPSIPVVAASGYQMSDDVDLAKTAGIRQFVPKPYTTAELLWAVHNALSTDPDVG